MPKPTTFVLTFCPVLASTSPVENGAQLSFDGSAARLDGIDRETKKQTEFSGQVVETPTSRIATFTSHDGRSMNDPFIFESFPIAVAADRVMVGAFYQTAIGGPSIPPDDVGSYVAIEPDGADD